MSELTISAHGCAAPRRRGLEFKVYFGMIFAVAFPFKTIRWIRHVIEARTLSVPGPLTRARAEADRITPIIFSA